MTRPARSPIPQGVATFLPVEAGEKRAVEDVVFSVFGVHVYRKVIPPTFEYLDILAPGLDAELIEKSYKVVDRATGRILVVRPDVTAQIARMVAVECLRRLGVTAFTIAIGQGAFFNALLRRTGVAESVQRSLREAAARKDVPKMEALLHQ